MVAKNISKEWLWIAAASAIAWMAAATTAAAQSPAPVQFAVQQTAGTSTAPVRTALYTAGDRAQVNVQPVWYRNGGWGWRRPYAAYYGPAYYSAPYSTYYASPYTAYYPAPYTTYYSSPYTAYYTPAPYVSYYSAPSGYYVYPRRTFYAGPRYYGW